MENIFNKYSKRTITKANDAELLFKNRCIEQGWLTKESTNYEDRRLHCDLWVRSNSNKEYNIFDVKDAKSLRAGEEPSDTHVIVELRNGWNYPGWIFSDGYLAFKHPSGEFYIVSKKELADYTVDVVDRTSIHNTSAIYHLDNFTNKLFRRKKYNEHEIFTYIKWDVIKQLSTKVI